MILLVRPEAENDLAAARDWYDQKRAGLGDEFLDEIASAMMKLENNPLLPRLYYRDFRRVLLRRFPYKVFYQVINERIVEQRSAARSEGTAGRVIRRVAAGAKLAADLVTNRLLPTANIWVSSFRIGPGSSSGL